VLDISSLINRETRSKPAGAWPALRSATQARGAEAGKSRQFAHSLSDKLAYGQALGAAGLGQAAVETRQLSPYFRGDSGKKAGKSLILSLP